MIPQKNNNWLLDPFRRRLLMGVLNITPDSFSDGGRFLDPQAAIQQAQAMSRQGAEIIDIGGESTRPGSDPVPANEQIGRIVPVIKAISTSLSRFSGGGSGRVLGSAGEKPPPQPSPASTRERGLELAQGRDVLIRDVLISVDTTRAAVAEAALDAGADWVNDVSAGRDDPDLLPLVAQRGVPIVLMHRLGTPRTMQQSPQYQDVVAEVRDFLLERIDVAKSAGIQEHNILIDPGIGFGKTTAHNLALLKHLDQLVGLGRPVLIGVSRKRFIGEITGETDPAKRLFGTAAAVAWCVANGAAVVRVHDVEAMRQVRDVMAAIVDG